MTLSDISIRKPVFAWMLMIGLIVFGSICFMNMGISQLPDVDFPILNISVTWVGAAPEVMESAIADVIEDAVMSVEGIKNVTSNVQEGLSNTTIEFELNTNIDVALQQVQTKIAQAQKTLPNTIDPPIVTKSNPEDQPILWGALTGGSSLRDKIVFIRDHLKNNLTTVAGVGDVRLGGYVDPNMRIWLNVDDMRRQEISIDDVINGVKTGTVLTPSGYIDNGPKETNIRILGEAKTPQEFADLVIPTRNGLPIWRPIKVGQVAKVEEGLADIRRISRMNFESAVGIGVIKQRGSNAVAVGDAVKARVVQLKSMLPKGMNINVVVDTTRFIRESTNELVFTLCLSALLTSVVCYLFLGSWGSAFNVILAIPTSLIGAFIILSFLGFTINTFTLLALSLSIGIVVDDAIMVLENIVRYYESGMSRVQASLVGAREITGAATAASLAILAIFLPVVFMKGIIGKFFYQFGITMSVAVLLSLLEALTLAPMRCSQFLRTGNEGWIGKRMNKFMDALAQGYHDLLKICLNHRVKVLVAALLVFVSSLFLLGGVRKEFVPAQDQSQFLVTLYTPLGSSMEFTDNVFKEAEKITLAHKEVHNYYSAIGGFQGGLVNQGNMFVVLNAPGERPIDPLKKHRLSQQEFMAVLREDFKKIPGVEKASMIDLSLAGFSSSRGLPVSFSVQGPELDKLADLSKQIMEKMKASKMMADVDSDYNPHMPEVKITPDRWTAAERGVTVDNIANSISSLVGSLQIGRYTDNSGHRDDIRVKMLNQFNKTPEDISKIQIRNSHGEMVPLSQLVKFEEKGSMLTIGRFNRERAVSVGANLLPGISLSDAMDFVTKESKKILPEGYHVVLSGSSQAFKESIQSLLLAFILGIFVAYMVLGAQFNSFIHPFTVLLALPFSVTGAFLALRVLDISLNIYSMIGMLLLMGIVKKNSILLVEFTNHKRSDAKLGVREALLEACPLRLRPIIMTSVATVTAAIPSALAFGPGAETTRPMSVVVIGGVIFSTLLTLIVVPCAYSLMARFENQKHQKEIDDALDAIELGISHPAREMQH